MPQERLQKLLAAAGVASRRSSESLISAGKVTVNGKTVTELGFKADFEVDDIRVNGRQIKLPSEHTYILLNKPTGYVSTVKDPHATHTVMDLVREAPGRLYPVGRLDADTAGLLILTNDGAFTEQMTHPSHQIPKTYRVIVRGEVSGFALTDLRAGIMLEDGMTAPADAEIIEYQREHNATVLDITIHEGRNRQIRRMLEAVGYPALALTRMQFGSLTMKGLAPGTWRKLRPDEVSALLSQADSTAPSLPQQPAPEIESAPARSSPRQSPPKPPRSSQGPTVQPKPGHLESADLRAAAQDLAKQLGRDSKDERESRNPVVRKKGR